MARKKKFRLTLQYNSPVILTFSLLCLGVLGLEWLVGDTYATLLVTVYPAALSDPLTHIVGGVCGAVLGLAMRAKKF